VDLLVKVEIIKSKGEGHRLIIHNGIRVNENLVSDQTKLLIKHHLPKCNNNSKR
jgi:tyrosyl-tRNA synthetase